MDRWVGGWMDGWMKRQTNGWMDRWVNVEHLDIRKRCVLATVAAVG